MNVPIIRFFEGYYSFVPVRRVEKPIPVSKMDFEESRAVFPLQEVDLETSKCIFLSRKASRAPERHLPVLGNGFRGVETGFANIGNYSQIVGVPS